MLGQRQLAANPELTLAEHCEAFEEALIEAIDRAFSAVTLEDAKGWFAHRVYLTENQRL